MLDKVRKALRITHNSLDDELIDVINACKLDLSVSGVKVIDEQDALIQHAIKTYAKAEYEQDVNRSDRLRRAYESIKLSMCLCGDYCEVQNEE